jgi:hypothetical protein
VGFGVCSSDIPEGDLLESRKVRLAAPRVESVLTISVPAEERTK